MFLQVSISLISCSHVSKSFLENRSSLLAILLHQTSLVWQVPFAPSLAGLFPFVYQKDIAAPLRIAFQIVSVGGARPLFVLCMQCFMRPTHEPTGQHELKAQGTVPVEAEFHPELWMHSRLLMLNKLCDVGGWWRKTASCKSSSYLHDLKLMSKKRSHESTAIP